MASKFNINDYEKFVLSARASDVLYDFKVLKKICLMLNREDTLANWKDLAGNLEFTNDEIFGHFARQSSPAESVLTEWMINRKGELGVLIKSFQENEMYACLDELKIAIEEYKKQMSRAIPQENAVGEDKKDGDDGREGNVKFSQDLCSNDGGVTQSMKKNSNALHCENLCTLSAKENHCEQCRSDSSSKIPELIRFKDYESKSSSFDSNSFNKETELFAQEKSTSLLKKFFRTLSSDSSRESKHRFNDRNMTEFKRSKSENFSDSKITVQNKKKKKSLPFKIPQPKVFKERKSQQDNECERANMSPGIKKSCNNESEEDRYKVAESPCQESDSLETCLHKNDQGDAAETSLHKNDQGSMDNEHCAITCHQPETNEKLQRNFLQQSTDNKEHNIVEPRSVDNLLRPASTSSDESFLSPVACDSGFNSAEESKRVFIIHGKDKYAEAKELYTSFQTHSNYDCRMEAVNSLEVAEDKPLYIMKEIMVGDFVLICVSPLLKKIFEAGVKEAGDLSLTYAGSLIRGTLYTSGRNPSGKFMTVITGGSSSDDIPFFLLPYENYFWPADRKKMENIIEGRPEFIPPPISTVRQEPRPKMVSPPTFS